MSLEVTALRVVFEDDDTQETLVYSGQTTLAPCKFCKLFPKHEETLLNKNWGGGGRYMVRGTLLGIFVRNPFSWKLCYWRSKCIIFHVSN